MAAWASDKLRMADSVQVDEIDADETGTLENDEFRIGELDTSELEVDEFMLQVSLMVCPIDYGKLA